MADKHADLSMPPSSAQQSPWASTSSGPSLLYTPFPPVMTAYFIYDFSISALKSWKLVAGGPSSSTTTISSTSSSAAIPPASSSASTPTSSLEKPTPNDSPSLLQVSAATSTSSSPALFSVTVHTGTTGSGPLGIDRPGVYLHNGPYRKDLVLAACGDHSSMSICSFNNNSYVMMPARKRGPQAFDESVMRAAVDKAEARVVLGLEIEVAAGRRWRKARFEWRKVGKKEVGDGGGWIMVMLADTSSVGEGSGKGVAEEAVTDEEEVVAVLRWAKGLKGLSRAYTVEFQGRGLGELGERFQIAVVVTTAWITILRFYGRTTKTVVATGEKIRSK